MSLPTDLLAGTAGVDRGALLARTNPSAKLAVAVVLSAALVLTTDAVTAGVALALVVAALPWSGLSARALWRRGWVLVVAAVPAGRVHRAARRRRRARARPARAARRHGRARPRPALAIVLRILAIGLPGVVLLSTTDPTDLADSLAQDLRLPSRFVLSALAAMRLFGVLAEEWTALGQARRARGLGDEGLLGRARGVAGQLFALLVLSVRRATVLATAMEARGFGASRHRTWARPSRVRPADVAVVLGGVAVAAVATAAGVAAGTWELVLVG